jgi:hypothetical protein
VIKINLYGYAFLLALLSLTLFANGHLCAGMISFVLAIQVLYGRLSINRMMGKNRVVSFAVWLPFVMSATSIHFNIPGEYAEVLIVLGQLPALMSVEPPWESSSRPQ